MPHIFSHKGEKIYTHHSIDSYPDSNVFNMHAHDWLEILYFISGKGQYIIKDTVYPMDAGDIFVIRPGEMHKLQIDSSVPYERIVIRFSPALLDGWDSKDSLLKVFYDRPEGSKNRFKSEVSTKVKTAFRDYSFDEINNIELNLFGRLLLILTALESIYTSGESIGSENIKEQLLSYVNNHIFEDLSVQAVAETFGKSRSQISRIFKQTTGTSLWDYIITKRLSEARSMIQKGESAHQAAGDCGFADYSAFYRAYKSRFGVSPRDDSPK